MILLLWEVMVVVLMNNVKLNVNLESWTVVMHLDLPFSVLETQKLLPLCKDLIKLLREVQDKHLVERLLSKEVF